MYMLHRMYISCNLNVQVGIGTQQYSVHCGKLIRKLRISAIKDSGEKVSIDITRTEDRDY